MNASPPSHKESANVTAESNSTVSSSQSGEIIETNQQIHDAVAPKKVISEEPSIDCKEDTVSQQQQQLNCHSQDVSPSSPTKVESIDTMAAADHLNANGSKIETTLNSCDKDYNEEKEFQRASKVHTIKSFNSYERIYFSTFF